MQVVHAVASSHQQLGVGKHGARGILLVVGQQLDHDHEGDEQGEHSRSGSDAPVSGLLLTKRHQGLPVRRPGRVRPYLVATAGRYDAVPRACTFSKMLPSGERRNSTGVAHSSPKPSSSDLRALVTAWSTGKPSTSAP